MEERLKALRAVCLIFAMWPLSPRKNFFYKFRLVSILAVVAICVIVRQIAMSVLTTKGIIITWVEFSQYNCRIFTTGFCLVLTNSRAKHVETFFKIVNNLESVFGKTMRMKIDYNPVKKRAKIVAFLVILKVFLQQFSFLFGLSFELVSILDYVVYNVPTITYYLLLAQWIVFNDILRVNLSSLNKSLKSLHYQNCFVLGDFAGKRPKAPLNSQLVDCGIIYRKLCTAGEELNKAFAWQILVLIPALFLLINFNSFQVCQIIKKKIEFNPGWLFYSLLYFVLFLEVVVPCVRVKEEAGKFAEILHKVDGGPLIEHELNSLILQSYHEKVEFNACGIFTLDGTLIYSFLGALTTYLVILLQFDV